MSEISQTDSITPYLGSFDAYKTHLPPSERAYTFLWLALASFWKKIPMAAQLTSTEVRHIVAAIEYAEDVDLYPSLYVGFGDYEIRKAILDDTLHAKAKIAHLAAGDSAQTVVLTKWDLAVIFNALYLTAVVVFEGQPDPQLESLLADYSLLNQAEAFELLRRFSELRPWVDEPIGRAGIFFLEGKVREDSERYIRNLPGTPSGETDDDETEGE
jgi:hypothetical protein